MKVLMVCSGGMSSSMVVNAAKKEAEKEHFDLEIKSIGTGEFADEIKEGYDLALVAPQVRHRFPVFEELAKEANVPIELIPPKSYSPLGGKDLLEQIKKHL